MVHAEERDNREGRPHRPLARLSKPTPPFCTILRKMKPVLTCTFIVDHHNGNVFRHGGVLCKVSVAAECQSRRTHLVPSHIAVSATQLRSPSAARPLARCSSEDRKPWRKGGEGGRVVVVRGKRVWLRRLQRHRDLGDKGSISD